MINWLITQLGGYTAEEYRSVNISLESWRDRCKAAETTVELFKEIMTRERERSERLEERLTMGVQYQQQGTNHPPEMGPVGEKRLSSWPRIRRELERNSRVKENAEVSREEIEKTIRGKEQNPV